MLGPAAETYYSLNLIARSTTDLVVIERQMDFHLDIEQKAKITKNIEVFHTSSSSSDQRTKSFSNR